MERITTRNVQMMADRLLQSMHHLGMVDAGAVIGVSRGSSTNGNAWGVELYRRDDEHGVYGWPGREGRYERVGDSSGPLGNMHYGFTARDCYDRLHAQCVALEGFRYSDVWRNRSQLLAGVRVAEVSTCDRGAVFTFETPSERDLFLHEVERETGRTRHGVPLV